MTVLHIYRAADSADSGVPLDSQDLIAPTPAWLARRTIDVSIEVAAHLYEHAGTDRYFSKKTTVESWTSFTWTDTSPPPPDEEVTSTFDAITTVATYRDAEDAERGYDIAVDGPDALKSDTVSLDTEAPVGSGWDNPPGSAIGSLKSGYPQTTVTDLGSSIEVETVYAYENGAGDTTTRTVTVTYTGEVVVDDLVAAAEAELEADWETAWDAAPALQWFTGGTIDTDSWSAPADLDAGTAVTARVSDLIGLGIRSELQPWLCRETATDNNASSSTDTDVVRVLAPVDAISTDDLAGTGTIFDNFVANLEAFDSNDPAGLLRGELDLIVLDLHTELTLSADADWSRSIKFIRAGRLLSSYSAHVGKSYTRIVA